MDNSFMSDFSRVANAVDNLFYSNFRHFDDVFSSFFRSNVSKKNIVNTIKESDWIALPAEYSTSKDPLQFCVFLYDESGRKRMIKKTELKQIIDFQQDVRSRLMLVLRYSKGDIVRPEISKILSSKRDHKKSATENLIDIIKPSSVVYCMYNENKEDQSKLALDVVEQIEQKITSDSIKRQDTIIFANSHDKSCYSRALKLVQRHNQRVHRECKTSPDGRRYTSSVRSQEPAFFEVLDK